MDQETVRTICYLARLEIDKDKAEKIENDLETIINLIGGLKAFDTENIEPLSNVSMAKLPLRKDIENTEDNSKEVLSNPTISIAFSAKSFYDFLL